jgi:hypothetical protein
MHTTLLVQAAVKHNALLTKGAVQGKSTKEGIRCKEKFNGDLQILPYFDDMLGYTLGPGALLCCFAVVLCCVVCTVCCVLGIILLGLVRRLVRTTDKGETRKYVRRVWRRPDSILHHEWLRGRRRIRRDETSVASAEPAI